MKSNDIVSTLFTLSSEKYKNNVVKMGIPEENSIGVSTGEIRKLAKSIGKSNELAYELWNTGFHEAKTLAVLLFDKKEVSIREIEKLMSDVMSWDLCDHLCKNLIIKIKGYEQLIESWSNSDKLYYKRGAFTLIASDVVHNKKITNDTLDKYLDIIENLSSDDRIHAKKAVSWALREIGKLNFEYQDKAIILAHELIESNEKSKVWVGKDALKELEKLVKVEGRSRLISQDSKMGENK